jgi:hypothetical protein
MTGLSANINIDTPVDACRLRLMMGSVPFSVMMMVAMVIATLITGVATGEKE